MSQQPAGPTPPPERSTTRQRLVAVWPFAITALVAVMLSFLVQLALPDRTVVVEVTPVAGVGTTPTAQPAALSGNADVSTDVPTRPLPTPSATPTNIPTPALSSDAQMAQELTLLRQETDRLWSAYYLARAASQLADAEAALRTNDLHEVEQVLATVGISLDRAYERSSEQDKGPISEFRAQVGRMHADLHIRPDGMDQEIQRLRQSMLSLVDESP